MNSDTGVAVLAMVLVVAISYCFPQTAPGLLTSIGALAALYGLLEMSTENGDKSVQRAIRRLEQRKHT